MSLNSGARLGPYEITELLGSGGMGEVYKARDTRLNRIVAVKVLPEIFAADAHFRERFEREARTVSQLNHPHICTLYDVGDRFLVMEYLQGETLATRLERGPLKLDEALKVAVEIGGALDSAHRAGIVHRDLKPGNVMLTASGAKLLDFGLAKQSTSAVVGPSGAVIAGATSAAVTAEGTIVGTFQYMAPEQLEGAEADARSDIFAFGAILYEMITGKKAFEGKTPVSLITSILRDQPKPITTLVPVAPAALDRIIRACLAKDPDARFRSAHDLNLQLEWLTEAPASAEATAVPAPAAPAVPRATTPTLPWAFAGIFAIAALAAFAWAWRGPRPTAQPAELIQFTIPPPDNSVFGSGQVPSFAISPDGRHIVFVATTPVGAMLFVRSLGSLTVRALPGTEQANYPFWSPDSRSVAFFAAGKLRSIQIAGGSPIVVCDAASGRGGTWNRNDVILFAPSTAGPLARVIAQGGAPTPATTLDSARGDATHRWPQFLPDGRHFIFVAVNKGQQASEVRVGSLDSRDVTTILAGDSLATYASGHLFFWRDGGVMAQPFDAERLQLKSGAFRVAEPVGQQLGYVSFSVSSAGVMTYARGSVRPVSQLTWRDRSGKQIGTIGEPGDYFNIALSPDERRVAVALVTGTPENRDIWVIELERGVNTRLTFDPASDVLPSWSPDGSRIVFSSSRVGVSGLYVKNADGSGPEELLTKLDENNNAMDWSRDGRFILYYTQSAKTGLDLWMLPLAGDRKPFPLLQTTFNEDHGAFSPDGRWVAYSSNESGREEVYVQTFPSTGGRFQVSRSGGTQPMWRGDGSELFFLAPNGTMMAASIDTARVAQAGIPQALFPSGITFSGNRHQYAVTKDGQRFLINVPQQRATPTPLTVVVNWPASVQK